MRYTEIAIDIEHHIKQFVPDDWKECIGRVEFVPLLLSYDVKIFFKYYQQGESILKDYLDKRFPKSYIPTAIIDFMKKG